MRKLHDLRRRLRVPASRPVQIMITAAFVFGMLALLIAQAPHESSRAAEADASHHSVSATPSTANGIGGNPQISLSNTATPASAAELRAQEGAVIDAPAPEVPESASNGSRFTMPLVSWTKVTDRYGAPRGGGLIHGGIDLALDHHAQVFSACTGTVNYTGYSSTYGNHVIVDCGDGWTTLYGHLSQILVSQDQSVDHTTILGMSGSTGYSTGEHLHFEMRYNGVATNPENYLDFHIAPGTPLSDGPIVFPTGPNSGPNAAAGAGAGGGTAPDGDTPVDSPEAATPTATATATATPIPPTVTPTPTSTPTATPTSRPVKREPTPPVIAR
ncbi:MAG: M23 family metallopeptidase [Tepidiformaceae bacterium]